MDREEIAARVAMRKDETLEEAIGWAAYWALLDTPPLERGAVVLAFAEFKREALADLEALTTSA